MRRTGFGVTGPLFQELRALGSRGAAVERMIDPGYAEGDAGAPVALASFLTAALDIGLMRR